ncbi:hypothetical protein NLL32_06805 [Corynebacterium propinquum]|uniref:hypothetical protein n=1 Tax=Corynebacterium propinquum TaxID=43769 RepID=UPI0011A43E12|nr:hypothetical protein [Corynebacterium propinquum]WKS48470.1 hypothetical protein NLL32_06805 [Corynebacterium propinquum]
MRANFRAGRIVLSALTASSIMLGAGAAATAAPAANPDAVAPQSTQPASVPDVNHGCKVPEKLDQRKSNVQLDVTYSPEPIDPTKETKFHFKGTGYTQDEPASRHGVYLIIIDNAKWKLNKCLGISGQGDGLVERWITRAEMKDGEWEKDIVVPPETFQPGKTYTVGVAAAHGPVLTERYFDRGINIKIPDAPKIDKIAAPTNLKATVDEKRNVKLNWDFEHNLPNMQWRATLRCITSCDRMLRDTRQQDVYSGVAREYTFVDSDPAVYVAEIEAKRQSGGQWQSLGKTVSEPFAVGAGIKVPEYVTDAEAAKAKLAELEATAAETQQKSAELAAQVESQDELIAKLNSEYVKAKESGEAQESKVAEVTAELEKEQAAKQELEQKLADAEQAKQAAQTELAATKQEVEKVSQKLAEVEKAVAEANNNAQTGSSTGDTGVQASSVQQNGAGSSTGMEPFFNMLSKYYENGGFFGALGGTVSMIFQQIISWLRSLV